MIETEITSKEVSLQSLEICETFIIHSFLRIDTFYSNCTSPAKTQIRSVLAELVSFTSSLPVNKKKNFPVISFTKQIHQNTMNIDHNRVYVTSCKQLHNQSERSLYDQFFIKEKLIDLKSINKVVTFHCDQSCVLAR